MPVDFTGCAERSPGDQNDRAAFMSCGRAHWTRSNRYRIVGGAGSDNVQGEAQQKLDVIANDTLLRTLGRRKCVAVAASEENGQPVIIRDTQPGDAGYCVLFDPLDGSSNIDVGVSIGTIFSILRHTGDSAESSILQAGGKAMAAPGGYFGRPE